MIRWFFPMKYENIKREAILNTLLSFITNGTDLVEFFSNVDEEAISPNFSLTMAILGNRPYCLNEHT